VANFHGRDRSEDVILRWEVERSLNIRCGLSNEERQREEQSHVVLGL
jgi:hypothetical protein